MVKASQRLGRWAHQALSRAPLEEGEAFRGSKATPSSTCAWLRPTTRTRAPLQFRVRFNAETGEVIEKSWREWRRRDLIILVGRYLENLESLCGIYIDCGWHDRYHVHYGSRILSERQTEVGIHHRHDEFDDNHSHIDYRMNVSSPLLCVALTRKS